MIIVTGGAGFIGSCIVRRLNDAGRTDIVIVDNISETDKWMNMRNKKYIKYVHKSKFLAELPTYENVEAIIHNNDISTTCIIQPSYDATADKSGTTCNNNHTL